MKVKKSMNHILRILLHLDSLIIFMLFFIIVIIVNDYQTNNIAKPYYLILILPILPLLSYLYLIYKSYNLSICRSHQFQDKTFMKKAIIIKSLVLLMFSFMFIKSTVLIPSLTNDFIQNPYKDSKILFKIFLLYFFCVTTIYILYDSFIDDCKNILNYEKDRDNNYLINTLSDTFRNDSLLVIINNYHPYIILKIIFKDYIINIEYNIISYQGNQLQLDIVYNYLKEHNKKLIELKDDDFNIIKWMTV